MDGYIPDESEGDLFWYFEEAKKQKIKKNDGGRSCANWPTSSWSWHQLLSWTSSSWQHWSSNETRERSDWKTSSVWSSSDSTRERSEWRSSSSWKSPFSWPWRMRKTFPRTSMTTKITSVCYGQPPFHHFCHLSFFVVLFWCERPFSVVCIAFCFDNCLAQRPPVSSTSCDLVCVHSDEKGSRWDYPCSHHIFLTFAVLARGNLQLLRQISASRQTLAAQPPHIPGRSRAHEQGFLTRQENVRLQS